MTGEWIDVSVALHSGMVHWPGDPPITIERVVDMSRGDPCNVSAANMGLHTGTHMDPPLHYVSNGVSLDRMPLDATIGPCRVVEIRDPVSIKPAELESHGIEVGERILFKTRNSTHVWDSDDFVEDFVYVSLEGARYLADRQVRTIGVDYLSVGGYHDDGTAIHRAILEAGIWIIEGLDLRQIEPGRYDLICLPLKVADSDGAPARAVLRPAGDAAGSAS
jgi:arylformamidase